MKNSENDQQSQKPLSDNLSTMLQEQQGSLCSRPVSRVLSEATCVSVGGRGIYFNDFSVQEDEIRIIIELSELG